MATDLTCGKPMPLLIKYSLPMFLSVAFQQIYNIADSIIAGRYIGEDALAAIGASYPITMLFIAVATGMSAGCSVIISQQFGMKSYENTKTAIYTALSSTAVLSVLLTLVGMLFCNNIMTLIDTPKNIFDSSADYLRIYIFGLLGLFIYNICNAAFTSMGDSKTPLYLLIGSSVGNIILDIVFIRDFQMGVSGAAWATLIAQGMSAVVAFIILNVRLKKLVCERYRIFSFELLAKITKVSIPSILQQSFVSVGNIFVQRVVNGFGSSVIAGYSSAVKINTFSVITMSTMSNAFANFTAQNIGASKVDRIKEGFKNASVITIAIGAVFTGVYLIFSDSLIAMFLKDGEGIEAVKCGSEFLRIVAPFYIIIGMKILCDGVLRGAALMGQFMSATFLDLLLRVALAYILPSIFNTHTSIWFSWPVGWTLAAVISGGFYLKGDWKKRGVV